ncbi:hypothetical protein Hanom_Chr07g00619221 [Helianthus anomalus]
MSTKEQPEDSSEEMSASLPPLKWSKEIFDSLVKNFKFPDAWGVRYPEEGQTAADAPAGYITLFWDYFADGNFRLPTTRFVLDVLDYYKFHISQLHPIGMVRIRHFEFLCRSMRIEPTINRFRDLKDIPSIELPERALVATGMSLHWKMYREDKPVYMEEDTIVSLYVVAYKREKGRMTTIPKGADEEFWRVDYLGIYPEKKKKKRLPTVTIAPEKIDAPRAQAPKGEKKGTRCFSES